MNTEQTPVKESLQVENTTFDPDLAVRGHHIYGTYEDGSGDTCLLLERDLDLGEVLAYSPLSQDLVIFLECNVRMATRAECDAAGVEYIEPPLNSEDESAMLVIAHLNGYEAGKKNAEARIKDLEDGIRNLFKFYGEGLSDDETSPAYERLFKLIGIEV